LVWGLPGFFIFGNENRSLKTVKAIDSTPLWTQKRYVLVSKTMFPSANHSKSWRLAGRTLEVTVSVSESRSSEDSEESESKLENMFNDVAPRTIVTAGCKFSFVGSGPAVQFKLRKCRGRWDFLRSPTIMPLGPQYLIVRPLLHPIRHEGEWNNFFEGVLVDGHGHFHYVHTA